MPPSTTAPRGHTLEALVADADGARGAVPVPAAELGAGLADVHVVDGPALLFRLFTLLDPSELCGTERHTEGRRQSVGCWLPWTCPASASGAPQLSP